MLHGQGLTQRANTFHFIIFAIIFYENFRNHSDTVWGSAELAAASIAGL